MRIRFILVFTISCSILLGQSNRDPIKKLSLRIDTLQLDWPDDSISIGSAKMLPLPYTNDASFCEVEVWPKRPDQSLHLIPSTDYTLSDSILYTGNSYRFKAQFKELTLNEFLKFSFQTPRDSGYITSDILLQAVTFTSASIYVRENDLFIGEEKVFEVLSNNPKNIILNEEWVQTKDVDYRFSQSEGKTFLHLVPNKLGSLQISIPLRVRKPFWDGQKELNFETPPLQQRFYVKASRLQFLTIDPKEITLNESNQLKGVEIQMDYTRLIQMNKTYRIENQENPGGPLIAELFTKQLLTNNKILGIIRPYNYHNKSDGYLYIKEGDQSRFISNFRVAPETSIEKISILREGGEWKAGNTLFPGETVELRIEGKSLHNARFRFEDLITLSADTLSQNEFARVFKLKVPIDIAKRKVALFNHSQASGTFLNIAEIQRPREFDYIYVSYGSIGRKVSGLRAPILHSKTIKDVVISFNSQHIDNNENLFGKQYLDIDLRVTGKRNELIEMRSIENIVVCPGNKSPRFSSYKKKNCTTTDISLNKYLSHKTYDLDEWSKISMTIKHDKTKYGGEGQKKEVNIILKKAYSFDMEVSFPAGLITISRQDNDTVGFGNLGGVSMAMIAQFSFYHPDKIAQYRPFKIGAGFLAFNAFNFSENAANRDVGIVVLGSLYPTKRDTKLSFPLYVGGGYFLKDGKWFLLVGPGIRVKL